MLAPVPLGCGEVRLDGGIDQRILKRSRAVQVARDDVYDDVHHEIEAHLRGGGTAAAVAGLRDRVGDRDGMLPEQRAEAPEGAGDYRYGWWAQRWRGHNLFWHSGWDPGRYSAMYLKAPEEGLTLIVLANTEGLWWDNSLARAEIDTSPVVAAFLTTFVE